MELIYLKTTRSRNSLDQPKRGLASHELFTLSLPFPLSTLFLDESQ